MKAYVLRGISEFGVETVQDPEPGKNEVIVRVKATGICGSDIPRIYRTGAHVSPLIPGHEFSGEVVETSNTADKQWQGKRVGVFPLIPCGVCEQCRNKRYEMCENYNYLGSRRDGGFAEYVAVPEANLIELPENVSYEEAAMLEPMAVAVHAMRKIFTDKQDKIAVCGLGTIGLLLLMFLKDAGAEHIYAFGNKDLQREYVYHMGINADSYCDIRIQDSDKWLQEQTQGHLADVFFECVGKREAFSQTVKGTAAAGRIMLVGNPLSDMCLDRDVYWKILRRQLTIMGTWNSSFNHSAGDDWHYVLERLRQKRIKPAEVISHRFHLENFEAGFHIMRDKAEDYGKVMGIVTNAM